MIALSFSTLTLADERSCEKECRTVHKSCVDKAYDLAVEDYIDVEVEAQWLSNKKIDDLYDAANRNLKDRKKVCRNERDTCKKSCNQD